MYSHISCRSILSFHKDSTFKICLLSLLLGISYSTTVSDVTSDVFGNSRPEGIIAAFGDFDANKATDIFVLSVDGKSVDVYESDIDLRRDIPRFKKRSFVEGKDADKKITSVVPGDFNGDAVMDLLITRKPSDEETSSKIEIEMYSGHPITGEPYLQVGEFRDQPIVVDANGDMISDMYGETAEGKRAFWIFGDNGNYTEVLQTNGTSSAELPPLKIPQSSAFLDLNKDLIADLCAVSVIDDVVNFEFWLNVDGVLTWTKNVPAPPELKYVGQASFGDFNGNHEMNIILPGCLDEDCTESAIYVWSHGKYTEPGSKGKWHKLDINFKSSKDRVISFTKNTFPKSWLALPLTLRMGDFNLDGYPDAIAVFSDTGDGKTNTSSFLLYNVGCDPAKCEGFSRTFSVDYGRPLGRDKPTLATFFDLKEDGVLDVLLTETTADGAVVMKAIEQDFAGDASFLKVVVVSGLCGASCKGGSPYGVNQVGPAATFESTTPTGGDQIGMAAQMPQSAYFSLQLPFVLFGLGQTPNYVTDLQVGIPYPKGQSPRRRTWSLLIPNSQVIVIPHPVDDPSQWTHELYVTPSRLVLLTGVSLLGTCAFIGIIVGLLHWRERIEDKKEKLQEAQRFHFDAM